MSVLPPTEGPSMRPVPHAMPIDDMLRAWLELSDTSYNTVLAVPTVPEI